MTKIAHVLLTIAMLAPAAAQGAAIVVASPSAKAVDGFSLPVLIDGADHVLSSVEDHPTMLSDPFGEGAVAFASTDVVAQPVAAAARGTAADGAADAAVREPLPEPATWLMMILGFFGLSFAVRRRSSPTGDRVRFS